MLCLMEILVLGIGLLVLSFIGYERLIKFFIFSLYRYVRSSSFSILMGVGRLILMLMLSKEYLFGIEVSFL